MSGNSLNRASTGSSHGDIDILDEIIYYTISRELKTVELEIAHWIEVVQATNHPAIVGLILRRIEDDYAKYEHVISQSINRIESVIHRVSSRMLRDGENVNELVRNHRDRLGQGQRISPRPEPITNPNIIYIDLTGPSCRICKRSIGESQATASPVKIAFLRGEEGIVVFSGMKRFPSRTQLEFTAYPTLVASVAIRCRDQQDCKVADISSVGIAYCLYEGTKGTKGELARHVVEDAYASVKALEKAIDAGANLQRTFAVKVLHTIPRQYSWVTPETGFMEFCHDLTPLHLAAWKGLRDTVALLLLNGVDIDTPTDQLRWTPLFFALDSKQSLMAKLLIDRGASLASESGTSAIHVSVAADLPDITEYLVKEKRINPNARDRQGDTPLIYAIKSPYSTEKSISHLFALGANLNQTTFVRGQYWSPLRIALTCQRWELAEQLIDNGANPEQTTYAGMSHPLLLALLVKSPKNQRIRKRLISKLLARVDPNMEVSGSHRIGSLLSILVQRKLRWETELLFRTGCADVESKDSSGLTPLSRALSPSSGSSEIAALLLRHGARILQEPITEILHLINHICQTLDAKAVKETLDYNKTLAPLFQLLFNHCSSLSLEGRDAVMTAFLDGCPSWMVAVTRKRNQQRLTNEDVLNAMRDQFEFIEERPRKAKAGKMKNWYLHKAVKRRRLNNG
ncbi:ankyrin repeat-containing domain protein [Xylaria venustula]|nr:ankyrin repeat-containing domain protein [Xylaria venustula]